MEELTGFGMKKSLTIPLLARNCFISSREGNDEPIYAYNDEYMRYLMRKNVKGGRRVS